MANREARLASIIHKNLAEIISYELKDPHLGFISIPEVKVSSDLSYATIYVSFVINNQAKKSLEILNKSKGFIRSSLAKKLDTRRVPELRFVLDESYLKEKRIEEALSESRKK